MAIRTIMFNHVCTTCKAYRATLGNQQRLTSTLVDPPVAGGSSMKEIEPLSAT